eukprot:463084-Rhodomonas_salina.2
MSERSGRTAPSPHRDVGGSEILREFGETVLVAVKGPSGERLDLNHNWPHHAEGRVSHVTFSFSPSTWSALRCDK